MNSFLSLSVAFVLLVFARQCGKEEVTAPVPDCIRQKIADIAAGDVRNPPAKVYRYDYDGRALYYFTPYCCDAYSELYDAQCNLICHPDGGITGQGDGRCGDFFSKRSGEVLVWEDERR